MALEIRKYDPSIMPAEKTGIKVDGNPNWQTVKDDSGFIRGIDHVLAMKDGRAIFDKIHLKTGAAAFILPVRITPEDDAGNKHAEFLLINEWKWLLGKDLTQIPQGGIDADETPADAARREVREETGYNPIGLVYIGEQIFDSAHMADLQPYFMALVPYEQEAGAQQLSHTEEIKNNKWMRMEDIRRLGLVDGKTTIGLHLAQNVLRQDLL